TPTSTAPRFWKRTRPSPRSSPIWKRWATRCGPARWKAACTSSRKPNTAISAAPMCDGREMCAGIEHYLPPPCGEVGVVHRHDVGGGFHARSSLQHPPTRRAIARRPPRVGDGEKQIRLPLQRKASETETASCGRRVWDRRDASAGDRLA